MHETMLFSAQNIHLEKSLHYLISFSFHTIPKGNHLPIHVFDLNIMRRYAKDKKIKENKLSLFLHQENAVAQWIANDYSLLMEMATGTGKHSWKLVKKSR